MSDYANQLHKTLIEEDTFLKCLIDKIPPKFFFDKEVYEKFESCKHAAVEKLEKATRPMSVKKKHKIARLDPKLHKTVTEIQKEIVSDSDDEPENTAPSIRTSKVSKQAANLDELRERLRNKIENLSAARGGITNNAKKKKAMRDKIRELKKKEREVLNRQATKSNKTQTIKNGTMGSSGSKNASSSTAPVFNKEAKMLYSKFDFADLGMTKPRKGEYSGKNYKRLLSKVEKENQKLEEIEEKDPQGAQRLKNKKKWKIALEKAEGIKVKNDPELLKKSLKKKEKQKKRSAKKWEGRIEQTELKMKKRQEKRKANIQARIKAKRDKKLQRLKKKGRLIPGK